MASQSLSWFSDLYERLVKTTGRSPENFEQQIIEKTPYLQKMRVGQLCSKVTILIYHFKKNHRFPDTIDLIELVAVTRLLHDVYGFSSLDFWRHGVGYADYSHLYRKTFHKNTLNEEQPCWGEALLHATTHLHLQELMQDPKNFLVEWRPSDIPMHQVCTKLLEKADFATLTHLYTLLLDRFFDLIRGHGKVQENDNTVTELWQSIADTREILDIVETLWLKQTMVPADYRDYLKSHNSLENRDFLKKRQPFIHTLINATKTMETVDEPMNTESLYG